LKPFPLPRPTTKQEAEIAAAAKELNELRERWLNPPEWTQILCILSEFLTPSGTDYKIS